MNAALRTLFIAAEVAPLAKVGGLADVIGSLPPALRKVGVDARIIMPKYGIVPNDHLTTVLKDVPVRLRNRVEHIDVLSTILPGTDVTVYLVAHPTMFHGGVYLTQDASSSGSREEAERFTFFTHAALEALPHLPWQPNILHSHDWHVGFAPTLLKRIAGRDPRRHLRSVLTIHNLEYQGVYDASFVEDVLDVTADAFPPLACEKPGTLNALARAITDCDALTTVSPSYAEEILTPAFGAGLEGLLRRRGTSLTGILNGIDTTRFDPETDHVLPAQYSANDPSGKERCKRALQRRCGFPEDGRPTFVVVSRLAEQKGIDVIVRNARALVDHGARLAVLGTGIPALETDLRSLSERHPRDIAAFTLFDASLAQLLYAGGDLFLMPSRFEPCGLGQMIAMRYGTIPVVRATGGLKDTVTESDEGNGFVFAELDDAPYLAAVDRALKAYATPRRWRALVDRALRTDFSWTRSATSYKTLYTTLLGGAREST